MATTASAAKKMMRAKFVMVSFSARHGLHAPEPVAALRPRGEALELLVDAVGIAGVEEHHERHVLEHERVHLVEDLLPLGRIALLARALQQRDGLRVVPHLARAL